MTYIIEEDSLAHYGVLRRSGRYPWGSGGPEYASNEGFINWTNSLKKQGLSELEIAKTIGATITELRAAKSIAKNEKKQADINMVQKLADKGYSNVAIGQRLGIPESTVRSLRAPGAKDKADILTSTANMLKDQVELKKFIDVGRGVENHIGVSENTLKNAVAVLQEQGYEVHTIPVPQLGTNNKTNVKVLAPPGTTWGDVKRGQDNIQQIIAYSEDHGRTYFGSQGWQPPLNINSNRIGIRYDEDGGSKADGVIYVRPGVKDVSIGGSSYAQVRIAVDGTHYLKGMAMYKTDLPDGVDLVFNTNKSNTGNKLDAMKPLERKTDGTVDLDNPFGANLSRQILEKDADGNDRVTSAMNIVNEEGKWSTWSRTLSSQMLSKQSPSLAKEQLEMTYKQRKEEYDRISELTNPAVKKKLLVAFGDGTDAAAVKLDAAAIPRTHGHHVILPIDTMPPTQIYAPNYRDGERVVLIRHPHGGTFEIPELVVNNKHAEARKLLGTARDAVGIHYSVAERLSGADFDGDTVLVIPNDSNRVKTTPALDGLKGFDPKHLYKKYDGMKVMSAAEKQNQMGKITNLIADMTIKGASTEELARAVKHSMVVIDAEKHELNYKQSAIDNGINQLKAKYQSSARGGSSTLITRAGSPEKINDRQLRRASKGGGIDPTTGRRVYEDTGNGFKLPDGTFKPYQITVKRLSITDDANELLSGDHGTRIERIYADHSNKLKALANKARLESLSIPNVTLSKSAAKTYAPQVASLNNKLEIAKRHAPLERQAQIVANAVFKQRLIDNPDMDDERKKKVKFQVLTEARLRTGAKRTKFVVTQEEWNAIQAGAVSNSKLNAILDSADMDVIRKLATPRTPKLLNATRTNQAKLLLDSGYTRSQVADRLGVSLSTLDKAIGEET